MLSRDVFLQPHPPQSSAAAAPLGHAAYEILYQMSDEVQAQDSWEEFNDQGILYIHNTPYRLTPHQ